MCLLVQVGQFVLNQGLYLHNFIFVCMRERGGLGIDSKMIYNAPDAVIASFLLLFIAVGWRIGLSFVFVAKKNWLVSTNHTRWQYCCSNHEWITDTCEWCPVSGRRAH